MTHSMEAGCLVYQACLIRWKLGVWYTRHDSFDGSWVFGIPGMPHSIRIPNTQLPSRGNVAIGMVQSCVTLCISTLRVASCISTCHLMHLYGQSDPYATRPIPTCIRYGR